MLQVMVGIRRSLNDSTLGLLESKDFTKFDLIRFSKLLFSPSHS